LIRPQCRRRDSNGRLLELSESPQILDSQPGNRAFDFGKKYLAASARGTASQG